MQLDTKCELSSLFSVFKETLESKMNNQFYKPCILRSCCTSFPGFAKDVVQIEFSQNWPVIEIWLMKEIDV